MEQLDHQWRKATYSGNGGANCVEVGKADLVAVRDTTNRDGGTLSLTAGAWAAFTAALK